jgi:hypothetical protein
LLLSAGVDAVDAGDVLADLEGYGTCMWLDLKPDCDRQRLAQQLKSISPFMLLNLRQLRWVVDSLLVVSRLDCRVRLWPAGGGCATPGNLLKE